MDVRNTIMDLDNWIVDLHKLFLWLGKHGNLITDF